MLSVSVGACERWRRRRRYGARYWRHTTAVRPVATPHCWPSVVKATLCATRPAGAIPNRTANRRHEFPELSARTIMPSSRTVSQRTCSGKTQRSQPPTNRSIPAVKVLCRSSGCDRWYDIVRSLKLRRHIQRAVWQILTEYCYSTGIALRGKKLGQAWSTGFDPTQTHSNVCAAQNFIEICSYFSSNLTDRQTRLGTLSTSITEVFIVSCLLPRNICLLNCLRSNFDAM